MSYSEQKRVLITSGDNKLQNTSTWVSTSMMKGVVGR